MLSKGATGYTYNDMNQLTSIGGSDDVTYDNNGNMITREDGSDTWAYGYDGFNQLLSVSRNGDGQCRFLYDPEGRRVGSYGEITHEWGNRE